MALATFIASMFCARRVSALGMLFSFSSLLGVSSCLYDSSDRCDAGQVFNADAGLCVCDKTQNLIAGEHGCVACLENEVADNDACSCAEGYKRPAPGAACAIVPEALGAACTKDADCTDATYATCHLVGDGTGYCTNTGCTANEECSAGYACEMAEDPAYCKRPPVGEGMKCGSDADCASTEATFCEYVQTKICFVECTLGGNDCFPGKECCDLTASSLGLYKRQICVDSGSCK